MKFSRRSLLVIAAVPTLILGAAAPANAVSAQVVDVTTGNVNAVCNFAPAFLLGPGGGLQVAFDGTATSNSPVTTLATNITCTVKTNFGSFGGGSLGLPGPASAVAGTSAEIPLSQIAGLRVCAYGTAFLQGGTTITNTKSSGC